MSLITRYDRKFRVRDVIAKFFLFAWRIEDIRIDTHNETGLLDPCQHFEIVTPATSNIMRIHLLRDGHVALGVEAPFDEFVALVLQIAFNLIIST